MIHGQGRWLFVVANNEFPGVKPGLGGFVHVCPGRKILPVVVATPQSIQ
jgi:hypothetical protein